MHKSKSDFIFQRSCCCGYKSETKSPIKEISNPMPLDSIFRNQSELQESFAKSIKTFGTCNTTANSSTFPRTTRKELPQIPVNKLDHIDMLINQVKSSFYREICDNDQLSNEKHKVEKIRTEEKKNQTNLVFVTSKILVGYGTQSNCGENNKVLRSLKQHYKKSLKIFHLNTRSIVEDDNKKSLNTISSLPHLMPFLDDIYNLLVTVTVWLQKSLKNVIFLNCSDKSNHLCALVVRFLLAYEDMNKRLLKIDKLILTDHESNALQYYERINLAKYHTPSLRRYTSTVANIMTNIIQFQPNLRHLHFIILKNIHSTNENYDSLRTIHRKNAAEDWKIQSIFLTVYQNFHLIYTSYKITLTETIETDRISYVVEPITPINGDILVIATVTNNSGFQNVHFRFQFHTCLLHGDLVSFKNTELDVPNNKDFRTKTIGLVELHLKNNPNIVRDHENMLLSNKYFVVKERGPQSRDIFSQMKLLDQNDKGEALSYTAGPVDGSLYAAIPKQSKSSKSSPQYEMTANPMTVEKSPDVNSNTPTLLKTFNNLEKDITDAAELIPSTNYKRHQEINNKNVLKNYVQYDKNKVELRGCSMKATKKQHTSFIPYRKSNSLSNNELPIKVQKEDHCYFVSFTNKSLKPPFNPNMEMESPSPYDNIYPRHHIQQSILYQDSGDFPNNFQNRMHESNYELVIPTNEEETHNEFISNINTPRENTNKIESLGNNDERLYDDLNNNVISKKKLYDNYDVVSSNDIYNVITSRNLWFKPHFSRQEAIIFLLEQPVGYFIIRTSTSLSKSYSMALKCSTSIMNKDLIENDSLDHIRHFIIDFNTEGYKIRGFINEKYYPDLVKLIHDHLDKTLGLPCRLVLPLSDLDNRDISLKENYACHEKYVAVNLTTSIINNYNVVYLGSFITKNLCDITAISASIDTLQERVCKIAHEYSGSNLTKMSLKITNDRIIFTDLNRKIFFRKHCKLEDILCCDVDPKRRVWSNVTNLVNSSVIPSFSPIFGVVSCLSPNMDFGNQTCCQLFLSLGYDAENICLIINEAKKNMYK